MLTASASRLDKRNGGASGFVAVAPAGVKLSASASGTTVLLLRGEFKYKGVPTRCGIPPRRSGSGADIARVEEFTTLRESGEEISIRLELGDADSKELDEVCSSVMIGAGRLLGTGKTHWYIQYKPLKCSSC